MPPHNRGHQSPATYFTPEWEEAVKTSALPDYNFGLGPPVLRALFYQAFGFSDDWYRIFQSILTWLLVPAVYYSGRVFGGRKVTGVIAAMLYGVSLFEPRASLSLGREIHVETGIVITLFTIAFAIRSAASRPAVAISLQILAGIGIALIGLFRNVSLTLLAALLAGHILTQPGRRAARLCLAALAGWLAVATPVALWNESRIGHLALSDENGLSSLWIAVGLNPNPVGMAWTDFALFASAGSEIERAGGRIPAGFEPPLASLGCKPGDEAGPRIECGPWDGHTLANPYYFGASEIYERAAFDLWKQYAAMFPNHFFRNYVERLWINTTTFNRYASVPLAGWEMIAPKLTLTSRVLHMKDGSLQRGWLALIGIVPVMALVGALLALHQRPLLLVPIVPAALFLGQMSFAAAGIARHNSPVLVVYYLLAAFAIAEIAEVARRHLPSVSQWARSSLSRRLV